MQNAPCSEAFRARIHKSLCNNRVDLLPDGEPFSDWSHHDRDAHRERFNRVTVEPRREAAQGIRRMVGLVSQDENP